MLAVYRTPPDPALPALPELLAGSGAPEHVAEAARELAGVPLQLPGELHYVRYKPARSCVALWSFEGPDGRRLLLSGTLLAGDAGRAVVADGAFGPLAEEARAIAGVACAYRYLPDRRLLLQLFPLDANLPGLPSAAAAEEVGRALSATGALDGEVGRAEASPLSYKPWRRCVLRYRFESQGGEAAFVGKVYRDGRGEAIHRWLEFVRPHLEAAGVQCDVVTPAAYLPDARLLMLEAVAGATELTWLLEQSAGDAGARETLLAHVGRAAEALPAFRRALVPGVPHMSPADVLAGLERRARGLDRVQPALAVSVARRLRDLEAGAARLRPEPPGLTHGAFRHNQLLAAGDRLVLLDLDTLCVAGAGTDPGGFLAYLDCVALRRPRLRAVLADCEHEFVAAVEAHAPPSPGWFAWHRAAGHVKWALRSALKLAPGWQETADTLLRLAGRTLAERAGPTASLRKCVDPHLALRRAVEPGEHLHGSRISG